MEIGGIGRDYPAQPAKADHASASTNAASSDPASPKDERYDRLVHGLTSLNKATDEAEEQAKARAKQKLDDAKQQLQFMRRWGFDPEVIAKQAAQLGVIVAAAAREFTEALTGGSGAVTSAPANASPGTGTADPILDTSGEAAAADPAGDDPADEPVADDKPVSYAEQAYLDEMDEAPREVPKLSLNDIKTAMEFTTVARQIKALLEEAARRLREQNSAATVPGTQSLDASVNALTGTVSAMPTVSITI